jgi:RNA polymerase sigma-70 factor (ECF subfamily)
MTAIAEVLPVSSQTDLVRSAARGDALAFERLLASRADWAFRIARAMLGDESEARDATQDAFVSAWRELPRLRDPEAFDAWLRRILVNACRAQMRVRKRVREIRLDATVDPAAPGPGIPEQLGATDMLARARPSTGDAAQRALVLLPRTRLDRRDRGVADPNRNRQVAPHDAREALQRALVAEGEDRR